MAVDSHSFARVTARWFGSDYLWCGLDYFISDSKFQCQIGPCAAIDLARSCSAVGAPDLETYLSGRSIVVISLRS